MSVYESVGMSIHTDIAGVYGLILLKFALLVGIGVRSVCFQIYFGHNSEHLTCWRLKSKLNIITIWIYFKHKNIL